MPKFVYIMGLRGPEPQVLHGDSSLGVKQDKTFLQEKEISSLMAKTWSLKEIADLYPYKGAE